LRCKDKHATHILNTLEKFQLAWEGEIIYQSRRTDAYKEALQHLEHYPCDCSRKQIIKRTRAANLYDQYCLNSPVKSKPAAQRLAVHQQEITFLDQVQGDISQIISDFIILRKDNVFAYHLAVVVDDNEQGITHIVRGHDLLSSTANQIALQQLLKIATHSYAHIPIITDQQQHKLSKQTFAADIFGLAVEKTLLRIFEYLNLKPLPELSYASPQEILAWGVENWDLLKIRKLSSIRLK